MPTYEYECENTGRHFEVLQGMNDAPLKSCPECGGPAHRVIVGGAGIIFKGAGFYATDSRTGGSGAPACGRDRPCCGRDTPCQRPPCD